MEVKKEKKAYIHEYKLEHTENEEKVVDHEYLRDGPKGISFKVFKLTKGKKESFFKVGGKEMEDGTFSITVKNGEKEDKQTVGNVKELITFVKKHKQLAFVEKYLTKDMEKFRKTLKGGKRKASKKGSKPKKTTKKGSKKPKKTTKKGSKKPKKTTKKGSKKPKKTSKKPRKTSKKN